MTELWGLSWCELVERLRAGEVSAREVLAAHLDRIGEINPQLNAITRVLDTAMDEAAAADDAYARGERLGVLHGVPFTVKENIDCAGSPTTHGVAMLAESIPAVDHPIVERLRGEGAIVMARTNMPDWGLRLDTDSSLNGRTFNPWDPALTAGGSSGGECAALATGMTPLGLGNDIGGSVRNPAACCGVASLKPSHGRLPDASALPPEDLFLSGQLFLQEGPMARSVGDLRLALECAAGPHVRDPRCAPVPLQLPDPPRWGRVGVVTAGSFDALAPDIVAGIESAARVLEAAGYELEEVVPPELDRCFEVWNGLLSADLARGAELVAATMGPDGASFLREWAAMSDGLSADDLHALWIERSRLARAWAAAFAEHPVLLGPVWTHGPFDIGADIGSPEAAYRVLRRLDFITPGNLLGLPCAVVPVGVANGLPQTVQVVADLWRDDLALRVAGDLEAGVNAVTPIDPRR